MGQNIADGVQGPDLNLVGQKIDSVLDKAVGTESPGIAVAIVKDGKVVINKTRGLAELENSIPITDETLFNIGSVAKQFTSFAVSTLENEGRLSLEDDIRIYLPEMPDYGTPIKVSHLLYHTSGIRDDLHLWVLSGRFFGDMVTQQDMFNLIKSQKGLEFPTGSRFGYSDSNYTLLAIIVSRITGVPFSTWMKDNVLLPLGMNSTVILDDPNIIIKGRSSCYSGQSGGYRFVPLNNAYPGPSNIYSSISDMAKWLSNFTTCKVGGERVIQSLFTPGALDNGEKINYARGLEINTFNGNQRIQHGGTEAEFNADLTYFPDQKTGIIVLSNYGSNPSRLSEEIANSLIIKKEDVISQKETIEKEPAKYSSYKISPRDLDPFTGKFWFNESSEWLVRDIVRDGDKLFYVRSAQRKSELIPVSETDLNISGSGIVIRFTSQKEGKYQSMDFDIYGNNASKAIRIEPIEVTDSYLKEYQGVYYSRELNAIHQFEVRENMIYNISVKMIQDVPLAPLTKDRFTFFNGTGHITFLRNTKNQVTGYRIFAPRVGEIEFFRISEQ